MIRASLVLLTVGAVGVALTKLTFALLLPLVFLAIKIAFCVGVCYFIMRLVNPDMMDKWKERCCGTKD